MSPSLTRFDLYRIIIPGALSLGFAVIALRLLSIGEGVGQQGFPEFGEFLEDPLRAFVLAFGVGLLAYFVDPGYAMPEFWEGIPSAKLREVLVEQDGRFEDIPQQRFVGLYFLLFDGDLPEGVRERALLYGALFRVAVHAILGALLTALLLPVLMLHLAAAEGHEAVGPTSQHVWVPLFAALATLLMASRRCLVELDTEGYGGMRAALKGMDKGAATVAFLIAMGGVLPWSIVGFYGHQGRVGLVSVGIGVSFSAVVWLTARLGGRVGEYCTFIVSGNRYNREKKGYARSWSFGFDSCLALSVYVGLFMAGPEVITNGQQVGVVALTMFGLVLSFLRKHERQQHAIYKNQVDWMRRNIDRVKEAGYGHFGIEPQ